jgi:hypothetical protein
MVRWEDSAMLDPGNRVSIWQLAQDRLIFPEIPEFAWVEEECRHRKERLAAACRAFAQHGRMHRLARLPDDLEPVRGRTAGHVRLSADA